jgi:hypothetical protein
VYQAVQGLEKKIDEKVAESLRPRDDTNTGSLAEIRALLPALASQLEEAPKRRSTEQLILQKLYFRSMHSREDAIADTEGKTFRWLLRDEESNDENSEDKSSDDESSDESTTPDPVVTSDTESEAADELSDDDNLPWDYKSKNAEELKMQQQTRQSFLTWLTSDTEVYHISGKAGSGKSTLMKFLCEHPNLKKGLQKWAGDKHLVFAKFFFWSSGDQGQKSLEGLYKSLLYEILNQCPELIKDAFPNYWSSTMIHRATWSEAPLRFAELKKAMDVIVGKHSFPSHRFCFFIDGLDEFEGDSTDHWDLARKLESWAKSVDVKICVSSRPYLEFLEAFDGNHRMHLHELTRSDMRRYTSAMLAKEPKFDSTDAQFAGLTSRVVENADGVFLWVRLVVRSLTEGIRHRYSISALFKKLNGMPRGLDALFDQLFSSIDPGDREKSDKMLALAASQYPLGRSCTRG